MNSYIVKIGRSGLFGSKPLNIINSPDSAPFKGNAFLPGVALIPLRQHSGAAARPIIQPGTPVREGQVIAVPQGENSAYVYSSVPGILHEYRAVPLADQTAEKVAIIELSGSFELSGKRPVPCNLENASPEWLLSMIESLGLIRTFDGTCAPLAFLLRSFRREFFSADSASGNYVSDGILALRMYDFDPSCCIDSFLAKNYTNAVLEGCALVAKSLDVKRIFLLYQDKKAFASADLTAHRFFEGFEVRRAVSSAVYPSGGEYSCKREAAEAFEKSRPESVFCINPWTAFSLFNALKFEMPVLQRPVLIAGSAVKFPQILNVRIGTRIRDVVGECGGFKFQPSKAVAGGLIAGKALYDLDTPVDMNTDALHFFGKDERQIFTAERCIHCGRCMRICPLRLDPVRLALAAQKGNLRGAFVNGAAAESAGKAASKCIFCGACTVACPAGIPLHHIINGTLNDTLASAVSTGDREGQN